MSKKPKLAVVENKENSQPDGRRQRSQRSREKILNAMWELMLEGDMDPSAAAVAKHAKVGLRSVFRHFEDMDAIHRELVLVGETNIIPLMMKPYKTQDWKSQLLELVERTAELWDRIRVPHTAGEIRRFKSDILMDDYKRGRMKELASVKAVLPADLPEYDTLLSSLDSVLCFSTVRRLREDRNLSLPRTKEIMQFMVQAIIDKIE